MMALKSSLTCKCLVYLLAFCTVPPALSRNPIIDDFESLANNYFMSTCSFTTSAATPLLARLKAGPLVKEIMSNMEKFLSGKIKRKLSIYSGHDFNIGTLLNGLGVFDGNCPAYTATILMELIYGKNEFL